MLDREKIKRDVRINFASAVQNGQGYQPSLWMYKNGEKIISIIARTSEGTNDKDLAFREMCSTIIGVGPDEAYFVADAYFNMESIEGQEITDEDVSKRFNNMKTSAISAMILVIVRKNESSSMYLSPYFQSNDNRIWWLDGIDLPFGYYDKEQDYIKSSEKDIVNSTVGGPIKETLEWMMSVAGIYPFSTSNLFDILSDLGHRIYVQNNYMVD